jgi:hypothetical protein
MPAARCVGANFFALRGLCDGRRVAADRASACRSDREPTEWEAPLRIGLPAVQWLSASRTFPVWICQAVLIYSIEAERYRRPVENFRRVQWGILGIMFGIARTKTRRISIADGLPLDCSPRLPHRRNQHRQCRQPRRPHQCRRQPAPVIDQHTTNNFNVTVEGEPPFDPSACVTTTTLAHRFPVYERPDGDSPLVAALEVGDSVCVLSTGEWTHVHFKRGKAFEGWVHGLEIQGTARPY